MNCKEFIEFMMDYVGGELPPAERACFEEHVHECPECVAYVEMYKAATRLGKAACCAEQSDVPPDVPDELVRAILAARPRKGETE